jgi:hypothetical protein
VATRPKARRKIPAKTTEFGPDSGTSVVVRIEVFGRLGAVVPPVVPPVPEELEAIRRLAMFAEQITRAPPPLVGFHLACVLRGVPESTSGSA